MAGQFAAAILTGLLALAALASCNTESDILYAQRLEWKDPNNVLQTWDPTLINPCFWFHVSCNNHNSVIRVDLGHGAISGSLIPQLGSLKNLQYLELYGNNLNGLIPKTLGNLKIFVSLDLSDNQLTGTIPASLGTIRTLRFLRLSGNNLKGSIPASLGNLTKLENMELGKNALSGTIPDSLGNIKTLQFLQLKGNKLTGMVPLEILALLLLGNLAELNVAKNNLASTVRSSKLRVTTIIQDRRKAAN